jgi:hypothetical protein
MAYKQYYLLDDGVLRLDRAAWNDSFALDESPEPSRDISGTQPVDNLCCGSMAAWVLDGEL